jgi:hypothetical protein
MKIITRLAFVLSLACFTQAHAQTYFSAEGSLAWQSRNDQRIPGDGGSNFSFADFNKGPFPVYRLYVGHIWNDTHEVRALYAPLAVDLSGRFSTPVQFQNSTFAPNVDTDGRYRFNSYRLTYAYHFPKVGEWKFAVGFTGKIRDAEVALSQGALRESKTNVGFVPLLNLQASRAIAEGWLFRFDFDGLAAPQGRAFDVALFVERDLSWQGLSAFGGYRTVEGGADNKEVYNFAWIHYATLGVRGSY